MGGLRDFDVPSVVSVIFLSFHCTFSIMFNVLSVYYIFLCVLNDMFDTCLFYFWLRQEPKERQSCACVRDIRVKKGPKQPKESKQASR